MPVSKCPVPACTLQADHLPMCRRHWDRLSITSASRILSARRKRSQDEYIRLLHEALSEAQQMTLGEVEG